MHHTRQTAAAGMRTPPVRHIHSMAAEGTPDIPSSLPKQRQMLSLVADWDKTRVAQASQQGMG